MPAVLFVLLAQAQQARLDVLSGGRKIGVATYTLSVRKGGGRVTRLRMALLDGGTTDEISETDAAGEMVRSVSRTRRGKATSVETIDYSAQSAVVRRDGLRFVVPAPKGTRKDPSELWFRPQAPAPGAWALFQSLNVRKRVWEEVKVKYVGKAPGGGNLVRQSRNMGVTTKFVLDDKGLPISIESGTTRLVRR